MNAVTLQISLIFLSTYRITRLIVFDRIAQPVVARLQEAAEARWHRRRDIPDPHADDYRSAIGFLFSCPHCVSVWVAAALVVLTDAVSAISIPDPVLVAISAAAVTSLLAVYDNPSAGGGKHGR